MPDPWYREGGPDGCWGLCFATGVAAAAAAAPAAAGAFAPAVDLAPIGVLATAGPAAVAVGTGIACWPPPPGAAPRTEAARAPMGTLVAAKIEEVDCRAAPPALPMFSASCLTGSKAGCLGSGRAAGAAATASLWRANVSADKAADPAVRLSLPSDWCCCGCCWCCALRLAWSTLVACMSTCSKAGSMAPDRPAALPTGACNCRLVARARPRTARTRPPPPAARARPRTARTRLEPR